MKSIVIKLTSTYNNLAERLKDIPGHLRNDKPVSTEIAVNLHVIHENVSMIKESVYSLSDMCFNFLYSEPSGVLSSVVKRYGEQNSAVNISFEAPEMPVYIRIPKNRLEKVISVLIENSVQSFLPGVINPEIKCSVCFSGESLVITVEDNGPGIPEKIMKSLFKKGTSGKSGGYGTGLHTAALILEEYGAQITCNTGNEGTQFDLVFKSEVIRNLN